jgi:hypothetical protein
LTRRRYSTENASRGKLAGVILSLYLFAGTATAVGGVRLAHQHSHAALSAPRAASVTTPGVARYLVLMVLDGARPDYFNVANLPHLDALRSSGTTFTNAFDGILEAETPAGHATIATGSRPDRSGILGFDWANDNDRYSLFSPDKMGDVEQILENAGAPTIASLYKARYPTARVVALSGHKYYAAAPLGGPSADAIMYYQGDPSGRYIPVAVPGHVPPASLLNDPSLVSHSHNLPDGAEDHLATKLALASVTTMHPRVLLINYPEFDWPLGHVDGGNLDPKVVTTDMTVLDSDLGEIEAAYRKAGILNQTLFVITADHGMMPIKRMVPSNEIEDAVARAGATAPDIASNTADYIWLADKSKAAIVASNIMALHDPGIQGAYYAVSSTSGVHYVSSSPLPAPVESANQYLLGALLNGHEPTVVVFGKEGTSFSSPNDHWKGDHGGNSWESQHMPLVMAGPGVRRGVSDSAAAQLDDIAPTALAAMGVGASGMEGHVLTEALARPTATLKRDRAAEVSQIGDVAHALLTQGAADLR